MTTPRRPPSGSQARAERSRRIVVEETVRYILEEGFPPPSIRRITERAGLTWGTVQYHFGDLDGILMAVVDAGFAEVLETLDTVAAHAPGIGDEERPAYVVDAVWQAFSRPASIAAMQILIATCGDRTAAANARLADMAERISAIGQHLHPDLDAALAKRLGNLIWHAIRGMVTVQMLWPEPFDSTRDRQMLVEVLSAFLAGPR
ncbi:TetR/AcrR family transcriptional regulator [Mycolicibacterium pulveris]|uniref:TetR/AcrR family transcriptional regulator n=1 Tax=Mycolicibacterium pulveris TaxID=36813 RepID=UPI003CF73087